MWTSPPLDEGRMGFGSEPCLEMRVRVTTGVVRVRELLTICSCWKSSLSCGKGSGKAYGRAHGSDDGSGRRAPHWLSYWRWLASQRAYSEFISDA